MIHLLNRPRLDVEIVIIESSVLRQILLVEIRKLILLHVLRTVLFHPFRFPEGALLPHLPPLAGDLLPRPAPEEPLLDLRPRRTREPALREVGPHRLEALEVHDAAELLDATQFGRDLADPLADVAEGDALLEEQLVELEPLALEHRVALLGDVERLELVALALAADADDVPGGVEEALQELIEGVVGVADDQDGGAVVPVLAVVDQGLHDFQAQVCLACACKCFGDVM